MSISPKAALAALDREIARASLSDYAKRVSPDSYEQPDQVVALLEQLQTVEEKIEAGIPARVIVEMPPRSSKSTHVSRIFPSWHLGRHPDHGVILASYSDLLATDNGRAVRDFLGHPAYPFATKLKADAKAAGRWMTERGGGLIASGVGTGLTGWPLPGNLVLVDDPVKGREEAESELTREATWLWWQETLLTRVHKGGAVVVTGTRWHEDDLIGRILNSAGASEWVRLRIPYLAEADDPLHRAEGVPLSLFGTVPSVDKGEISSYGFSALYQQSPSKAGGSVFKKDWMQRRYCVGHANRECPRGAKSLVKGPRWRVIQAADLGGKQGVGHDPTALATWGTDGISKVLLDYISSQDEYADVKPAFVAKYFEWKPRMVYVEDATWAQPLISDLRRASGVRVKAVPAEGSKWTRADAASAEFEGGLVMLPCEAPWLDAWMHEHTSFPNAKHDEAVDTTSYALKALGGTIAPPKATAQPDPLTMSNVDRLFIVPRQEFMGTTVPMVG